MNTEKEKQDAADKPVKVFEINYVLWDDGDIRCIRKQIVKQDRGAPEKWLLDSGEFIKSLNSNYAEDKMKVLEQMAELMGITVGELRQYYSSSAAKPKNVISMPEKPVVAAEKAPTAAERAADAADDGDDEFNFDKSATNN